MTRALCVLVLAAAPGVAHALAGGPDAFGYSYIDSDEAHGPAYSWTDISGTGAATGLSDDGEVTIPLPFTFWFYGLAYTSVTVGDGALLFGTDDGIYNRNACLPTDNCDGDDALILPMWDDLNAEQSKGGDVYWEVLGTAPEQRLVVQYEAIPHYDAETAYTFQAILIEDGNQILLQYASVSGPEPAYDNGGSATVGIQASTTLALEYSCDSSDVLHDELAVLFTVECEDADGDGAGACEGDCDDDDPDLGPTVAESDDGLDNDCDGLVDEDWVAVGDVVITELLADAGAVSDSYGEWFELHNVSGRDIDLVGWSFADSEGSVVVDRSVVIPAGGYALLADEAVPARNGGLQGVDWVFDYDAMHLNNTGDELRVLMGGTVIDEITYRPADWPVIEGVSCYLDPGFTDAVSNDSPVPWCATPAQAEYDFPGLGLGDYGTPGAPNPPGLCCHDDDGDGWDVCVGDCDDDDPDKFPGNPELADLLDNDCDGFADEDFVSEGSVVVTEVMDDPYAVGMDRGEWFELYNAGSVDLNLQGWTVSDAVGDGFTIAEDLIIQAGAYAVVAVDADPELNGGLAEVAYTYDYDSFPLDSFTDDSIALHLGDLQVSALSYSNDDPWPSALGQSSYLCPGLEGSGGSSASDDWRASPASPDLDYGGSGTGDYGSPGAANPALDLDGDGVGVCDGDCDDGDAAVGPGSVEQCDNGVDDDCDGAVDAQDSECDAPLDTATETDQPVVDDTGEGDGEKGGCEGCASGGRRGGPWLLGLLLAGLALRRRR